MTHAQPPIQVVTSNQGLTAWLVESHSIPMVSVEVAFRAGSAWDPKGREGTADFMASLLDEGAADLDGTAFKEALEDLGSRFGAGADKLDVTVSLDSLSEKVEESFALLGKALTQPRFEAAAAKRIQEAMLASIKRGDENPDTIAGRAFAKALYGEHPYGTLTGGTPESVGKLSPKDAEEYHAKHFNQANMVVSVVGDITPEALKELLDRHLAALPAGEARNEIAHGPTTPAAQTVKIEKDVPQSSILVGHLGMDRHDPDYYAAYVMNYILGGGSFQARLMQEVRVKRGLTYGIYSTFQPMPHQGAFVVKVQTKNADAQTSIDVIEAEMRKIQEAPVGEDEFADAIRYLVGSFPLRLESNSKILNYLTAMQMENLGLDYLETWTDKIEAVTLEQVHQAAQKRLQPDNLVIVVVGAHEAAK